MTIPTLATERLILRGWTEADAALLHRIYCQEGVLRYFPQPEPPPRERIDKLIQSQLDRWEKDGYGLWAVDLKESGTLIGWCGLQFLQETDEIEVGYLLGRPYWGNGYATEAALASLHFAFETVGLRSVIAIVHPENIASQRVIEKLGMDFVDENHYFGMDCYRYVKFAGTSRRSNHKGV
jgi:ribosomal-protein-alanine N-acetyltransferase